MWVFQQDTSRRVSFVKTRSEWGESEREREARETPMSLARGDLRLGETPEDLSTGGGAVGSHLGGLPVPVSDSCVLLLGCPWDLVPFSCHESPAHGPTHNTVIEQVAWAPCRGPVWKRARQWPECPCCDGKVDAPLERTHYTVEFSGLQ